MQPLLEFIAVLSVGVLPSILSSLLAVRNPAYLKDVGPGSRVLNQWIHSVAEIAVVSLVALNHPGGLASVGLYTPFQRNQVGNQSAAVLGSALIAYVILLLFIVGALGKAIKKLINRHVDVSNPLQSWLPAYRDSWERVAFLSLLPFPIIGEELVYRGYLVLLCGAMTGTFVPWILLSVALSVVIHLYQGVHLSHVIQHSAMAGVFIAAALITNNLIAAIVPHLLLDLYWFINAWPRQDQTRTEAAISKRSKTTRFAYSIFIGLNLVGVLIFALLYLGS